MLLFPLVVATQCDDDLENSGFETEYVLQNDSSIDLLLLTDGGVLKEIESLSNFSVGSELNQVTNSILPSESYVFNGIKFYKKEASDFILVYEQAPIVDDLWVYNEPSENRYEYTLIITDALID